MAATYGLVGDERPVLMSEMDSIDPSDGRLDGRVGFTCPECKRVFSRQYTLNRHLESTHGIGKKNYSCVSCSAFFTRRDSLRKHERSHHSNNTESTTTTAKAVSMPLSDNDIGEPWAAPTAIQGQPEIGSSATQLPEPQLHQQPSSPTAVESLPSAMLALVHMHELDAIGPCGSLWQTGIPVAHDHPPLAGPCFPSRPDNQGYAIWPDLSIPVDYNRVPWASKNPVEAGWNANSAVNGHFGVPPATVYDSWHLPPSMTVDPANNTRHGRITPTELACSARIIAVVMAKLDHELQRIRAHL
jgi:uncharacterized C2H2 Zn-finger protein